MANKITKGEEKAKRAEKVTMEATAAVVKQATKKNPKWEFPDLQLRNLLLLVLENIENLTTRVNLLTTKVNKIMATMAELEADLMAVTEQVSKIGEETAVTLQKVIELEEALAAGGGTTPEVDAAMAALKAQVQLVDDLVPDTSAPPA